MHEIISPLGARLSFAVVCDNCARMSPSAPITLRSFRRFPRTICVGIVILLAWLLVPGCSSGGGSSPIVLRTLDWARFRRDVLNSGQGTGNLSNNPGTIQFSVALPGGVTSSTPTMGDNETIYVGCAAGLVALDSDGENLRLFEGYMPGDWQSCSPPSEGCQAVGAINSSPALTSAGDIVVQAEDGRVLALHDDGEELTCEWVFEPAETRPSGTGQSSPLVITDIDTGTDDEALVSVYVGTDTGHILALNGDGSEKWRVAPSGSPGEPITASLALSPGGTMYITTAEGNLHALGLNGNRHWRFALGTAWSGGGLLPSPSIDVSIYAVGPEGLITAVNPDGTLKWRHQVDDVVHGSPAFFPQYVGIEATVTPAPESTPEDPTAPTSTPTPTATPVSVTDLVVYVVDDKGTVYGIRSSTGRSEGHIALNVAGVTTSPAVNSQTTGLTAVNPFVVFGGDDGYIYVTTLDGERPCTNSGDNHWEDLEGGGARAPVIAAVRSSPIIGGDGTIYVTTVDGYLHAIGPPPDGTVACTTWTPTPTSTPTPTETPS